MSRCRACNQILEDEDLHGVMPNGEPEELCKVCRNISEKSYNSTEKNSQDLLDSYDEEW